MKIEKDKLSREGLPNYGITIHLEPEEAAKLVDIMGCNFVVPDALVHKGRKDVYNFMDQLFTRLNDAGFTRNMADWKK